MTDVDVAERVTIFGLGVHEKRDVDVLAEDSIDIGDGWYVDFSLVEYDLYERITLFPMTKRRRGIEARLVDADTIFGVRADETVEARRMCAWDVDEGPTPSLSFQLNWLVNRLVEDREGLVAPRESFAEAVEDVRECYEGGDE